MIDLEEDLPIVLGTTETLLDQATKTAAQYMSEAVDYIDKEFGKGFAREHPELVAAFIRTAATDFHTNLTIKAVCRELRRIANRLERLK